MDNLCPLILLIICCYTLAIKINDLIVPQELQHGKRNEVILDCRFQLENVNDTNGLVIKWYFQEKQLVYQWIPGKEPQALGILKDKVDLNYSISNDTYSKHRALRITKVTPDLTGTYTCIVSCFFSEATGTKEMVIYEPPDEFVFDHYTNSSELTCSAYDMSPKPIIKVFAYGINLTQIDEEDYAEANDLESNIDLEYGLYNVSTSFKYDPSELTQPTIFACELQIPKTSFRRVLNRTFYPEGEPTTTTTSDYDYETSTISPTTENSGLIRSPSIMLLSTVAAISLIGHL